MQTKKAVSNYALTAFCLLYLSSQCFTQPIEKSFFLGLDGGSQIFRQLLEQITLFFCKFGWDCHIDDHHLIAASVTAQMGNPFISEVEDLSRLGPGWNLQFLITI